MTASAFIIILVHGTNATGAPWCRKNSEISTGLAAALPNCEIEAFDWTGQNAHAARRDAGMQLAMRITQLCGDRPHATVVLIGHSHGGNVILHAMKTAAVRRRVFRTIFLGTPFLLFKIADLTSTKHLVSQLISIFVGALTLLIVGAGIAALGWMLIMLSRLIPNGDGYISWFVLLLLGLLWLCFLPVAITAVTRLPSIAAVASKLIFRQAFVQSTAGRARTLIEKLAVPGLHGAALVAYSPLDEAFLLLRALASAASAPYFVTSVLVACTRSLPLFIALLLLAHCNANALVNEQDAFISGRSWPAVGIGLMSIYPAAILASLTIFLIPTIVKGHRLAFGWMGLLAAALIDIRPSRLPAGGPAATIRILNVKSSWITSFRLVHSGYYQNPHVIEQIVQFLKGWDVGEATQIRDAGKPLGSRLPVRLTVGMIITTSIIASLTFEYKGRNGFSADKLPDDRQLAFASPIATIPISAVRLQADEARTIRFDFSKMQRGGACNVVGHYSTTGTQLTLMIRMVRPGKFERSRVNYGQIEWINAGGESIAPIEIRSSKFVRTITGSIGRPVDYELEQDATIDRYINITSEHVGANNVSFEKALGAVTANDVGAVLIANRGQQTPLSIAGLIEVICGKREGH